jgi:D,D-heptose 1,7-bisphosphate phosphatase
MQRAVFLDRDGTICRDMNYLSDPAGVELLPGAADALRRLAAADYRLLVVTNQSGIARGYLTEEALAGIHARLMELLGSRGVRLTAIYHCPHLPDGIRPEYRRSCDCRKPEPGLLFRAAREHGLDLSRSFMVGDKLSDIQAGKRGGCKSLLLAPAEPDDCRSLPPAERPDTVVPDLAAAADWILYTEAE